METITTKLRHLAERLALPLLCIATLPVAFLAGLATVLAWTLLLTRVALVYIEVLVTLIPDYLIRQYRSRNTLPAYYYSASYPSPDSPLSPSATTPNSNPPTPNSNPSNFILRPLRLIRPSRPRRHTTPVLTTRKHPHSHSHHHHLPNKSQLRNGDACMGSSALNGTVGDRDPDGLGSRSLADAHDAGWDSPAYEVLRRELMAVGDPRRRREGGGREGEEEEVLGDVVYGGGGGGGMENGNGSGDGWGNGVRGVDGEGLGARSRSRSFERVGSEGLLNGGRRRAVRTPPSIEELGCEDDEHA